MEAILRKDVLTETYDNVKYLIFKIVWKFKGRYGGNFEELLAEANLLYILAYDTHDETLSALSTWLYTKIWKGLLSNLRNTV